jgi:hypothetical protein
MSPVTVPNDHEHILSRVTADLDANTRYVLAGRGFCPFD